MKPFTSNIKQAVNATMEETFYAFLNGDPTKFYTGFGPAPACVKIENQSEDWPCVGASRKMITSDHHSSNERIVQLDEFTYMKLISDQFSNRQFDFIDRMESEIRLSPKNDDITIVNWTYTFMSIKSHLKTKVLASIFPQAMKKVMRQVKSYAEYGIYE